MGHHPVAADNHLFWRSERSVLQENQRSATMIGLLQASKPRFVQRRGMQQVHQSGHDAPSAMSMIESPHSHLLIRA